MKLYDTIIQKITKVRRSTNVLEAWELFPTDLVELEQSKLTKSSLFAVWLLWHRQPLYMPSEYYLFFTRVSWRGKLRDCL